MERRNGVALDPEAEVLPATGSKGDLPRSSSLPAPLARAARRRLRYARLSGLRAGHPLRRRGTSAAQVESWGQVLAQGGRAGPAEHQGALDQLPHNPTGATAPYEYLEKVATFCRAHDILLFSDECYNDLYFSDPPPSILEITRERTLAFCSCPSAAA